MAASRFSSAGTSTAALLAILAAASLVAAGAPPRVVGGTPQAVVRPIPPGRFVGHEVGADRKLVRWPRIVEYFEMLARTSDRVRVVELGRTTGGNRLIAAIVSSPSNLAAADELRRVASRLRAARGIDEVQARDLAEKGKAIVAITLNLHSTEIASSQMALELGYHLATDQSAETRQILAETVLLLIPSLNPDGQMMVCDWYAQGLGTPLEGGRLPWLYHRYAGHDNNRDWFMLNLVETRLVTRFIYDEWPVQALHDQHQMGARGARMFVPPYFDPINPNVHPLVWREIAVAGSDMAERLEERNYAGVVSHATYDGWRPGDMDTTPWWHNVPALITEAASVRVATPIEQKLDELTGEQRGLPTYTAQTNFPNPWRGGSWRLRDIVDYEFTAALGFLQSCARHKTDLLMNSWRMNRDAIERGSHEAPYAFVIPSNQDLWTVGKLLEPLLLAGVEVQRATGVFAADGTSYPAGSYIVLMAQPLRPYAKDLLEAQRYPDRRVSPGGPPEVPYDEAGWTLPYKMGLNVVAVQEPFTTAFERLTALRLPPSRVVNAAGAAAFGLSAESNATTIVVNRVLRAGGHVTWSDEPVRAGDVVLPAHSYFVHAEPGADTLLERAMSGLPLVAHGVVRIPAGLLLRSPRVGLYQPWGGSADEGWTRWVFEQFELPYTTLHREDVREGGPLSARFDTIVLPSMRARELMTGEASAAGTPTLPAPYAGGLGPEGAERLAAFVRSGGTLVAMDAASEFAIAQLSLPVRNVLADRRAQEFFCPGSILQVEIQPGPFLTAGFGRTADIFFLHSPAFELVEQPQVDSRQSTVESRSMDGQGATSDSHRRALAIYGDGGILRSGWILGDRLLQQRAALVEVPVEKGRVILVGFRPQFRGQTYGTFRVLFNAAYEGSAARGSSRP